MAKHRKFFTVLILGVVLGSALGLFWANRRKRAAALADIPKFVLHIPEQSAAPDTAGTRAGDAGGHPDIGRQNPLPMGSDGAENAECIWTFHAYEPSPWEEEWRAGEESGARRNRECEILAQTEEARRARQLIQAIRGLMLEGKSVPRESLGLFSRMVYARRCGPQLMDTGARRVQLIEPLVGLLRDPLTICPMPEGTGSPVPFDFGEDAIQAKRHLLIGPAAPWTDTPSKPDSWRAGGFAPWAAEARNRAEARMRQTMLVDMGASLYGRWHKDPNAVGALWFVDRYQRHRVSFDRIVSYEIEKHDPDAIYRNVPDDLLPRYVYYNQGVEATPHGKWNPWRILRGMGVTPHDYVAIKLDIDVPDIEGPLMQQLVDDASLQGLVDEMFFEHHVNVQAMWKYWGSQNFPQTLKDSYRLFRYLRSQGIRMHSWP